MADVKFSALATGTEDFTDAEIAVPAAGSAAKKYIRKMIAKVKPDDEVTDTDVVLSDDDTLVVPVIAGKAYRFHLFIRWSTSGIPDMKWTMSVPTGGVGFVSDSFLNSTSVRAAGALSATQVLNTGTGVDFIAIVHGSLDNPDNAGNLTFQWAQNSSHADNTTVQAGTTLIVWEEQ